MRSGVGHHLLTVCGGAKTPKNRYCPAAENPVTLHKTKTMKNMTGIFYGSTMGTTEAVAEDIAKLLGVASADVHNVADAAADEADRYDLLVLGSSTWGCGDLQDDWYGFLDALKAKDLSGKKVALFGCGDSGSYPDTFCDAIGLIYDGLQQTGCTFTGSCQAEGYGPLASLAVRDGRLLGLTVDESAPEKTDERVAAWCGQLKNE